MNARTPAAVAAATLCLLWVALWNGFPLMFPDTIKYLGVARTLAPTWDRPPFYGWAIRLLTGQGPLWPMVILQSAAVATTLWLTFRCLAGARHLAFLAIIATLAAGSSLPWFTGQIMCDFATPLLPLSLFLLAFCGGRLDRRERLFIVAMVFIAALIHTSHLLLAGALVAALAAARGLVLSSPSWRGLALFAGATAAAAVAVIASNQAFFGRAVLAPAGAAFALDRTLSNGTARAYLDRHCGQASFVLCRYREAMPTPPGWLLWSWDSPLWTVWATGDGEPDATRAAFETAAVEAARPEMERLLAGIWREFPLANLTNAATDALRQLAAAHTGEELAVHGRFPGLEWELADRAPAQLAAFQASRQDTGRLLTGAFRWIDLAVLAPSIALVYAGLRSPRRDRLWLCFTAIVLLALLANAAICGGLAGPANRYQARLVWLVEFAAALFLLGRLPYAAFSGMRAPVAGCATPPRSAPGSPLPQNVSNPAGRRRLFGTDSQSRNSSRS